MHMKSLSKRLRKYGLRYNDLYDPYYDLDVKKALNQLSKEVMDARHTRLKRAIDLSMKHEYLPDNLQVKREKVECEALGGLRLYQRSIPCIVCTKVF